MINGDDTDLFDFPSDEILRLLVKWAHVFIKPKSYLWKLVRKTQG